MRRSAAALALISLILLFSAPPARAELQAETAAGALSPAPMRIVSLNLCADELLVRLADRETIASVTYLSREARISSVSRLTEGLHINHGLAEEILPLRPDLVIAGTYTTRHTVALLRRLGVPLIELAPPTSLEEVYEQILAVAERIGKAERGAAMAKAIAAAIKALGTASAGDGSRPLAAVYRPNGYTVGPGTLVDELLGLAGLRNLAAEMPQDPTGVLPLELLLWQQPELLVLNSPEETLPSLSQAVLEHPVLARYFPDQHTVVIPPSTWSCGGPALIQAAERLQQAARRLRQAEAP